MKLEHTGNTELQDKESGFGDGGHREKAKLRSKARTASDSKTTEVVKTVRAPSEC